MLVISLFSLLLLVVVVATSTTFTSAQMSSFSLFEFNFNNTPDNIFGLNGHLNDNASLRIGADFTYVGVGIFNSQKAFTNESFHDKIINSLPAEWQPYADQFRRRLIILEYCSWSYFTTTTFRPCGELDFNSWQRFVKTIQNKPACMNRDESNGFQIVPYNPNERSTLVRFAFDGADREDYYKNILSYSDETDNPLGLCMLPNCGSSTCGAADVDAYNTLFDTRVRPRSVKLPSTVEDALNRMKKYVEENPGDGGAIAAIFIILIIFFLGFCMYRCLTRKQDKAMKQQEASIQQQVEQQTRQEERGSAFRDMRNDYKANQNNNNNGSENVYPNNSSTRYQNNNGDDDEDDEMAREIARARAKRQQQLQQQQQQQQKENTNEEEEKEMTAVVVEPSSSSDNNNNRNTNDLFSRNNDDDVNKHHTQASSQMGLGSQLFGLPRDGDQPAILSAPSIQEGRDTSAVDHDHDDDAAQVVVETPPCDANNNKDNDCNNSDTTTTKQHEEKKGFGDDIFA